MIVLVVAVRRRCRSSRRSCSAPKRPTSAKQAPYECGIVPEHEPAERFPVKFYLVAMAFIVLDVEIVFLYPVRHGVPRARRASGSIAMGVFLLVLLVPFAYLLSVGALDWGPVRQVAEPRRSARCCAPRACPTRDRPDAADAGDDRGRGGVDGPRRDPAQLPDRPARRPRASGRAATRCGPRRSGSRAARSR